VSWDYGRLVAEVYELDKPVGSSFPGLRYYTRQLAGVTGRILEPATGTGRVLVPLLEAGFAVEGLDVSADMLAVCRIRAPPGRRGIHRHQRDRRLPRRSSAEAGQRSLDLPRHPAAVRADGPVFSPRSGPLARAMLNGFGCCGR
jgi:hypothetical protein